MSERRKEQNTLGKQGLTAGGVFNSELLITRVMLSLQFVFVSLVACS